MTDNSHNQHDDEIDCSIAIEQLYAYIDGELHDKTEKSQFEQHLGHCRSCFSRLEFERALSRRMHKAADSDIPQALKRRLKQLIDDF